MLVEHSLAAGVELMLKTRFIGLDKGGISVLSSGVRRDIKADIVIGADGIMSSVGRAAQLPRCRKFLSGIQFEAPYHARDPEFVEIFTGNKFAPGFFGWAVPLQEWRASVLPKIWMINLHRHYLEELIKHPVLASRYRGSRTLSMWSGAYPLARLKERQLIRDVLSAMRPGQVKTHIRRGVYMARSVRKIAGEVAARAGSKGN